MKAPRLAQPRRLRLRGPASALLAGAAIGFAHPPFGFLPGLLGLAALLRLIDHADPARPLRSAFLRGWLAGFAYFLVGTWWVGEAFFVDAAAHGWQAPFAVTLLPAGLGLFWGAAAACYRQIAPPGGARALVFAATFALAEWLRGHVLSGFPWDLVGEAWRAGSAPSQGAALVGAYGMTLVTIAIFAAPGAAISSGPKARAWTLGLAALALAGLWGGGGLRLAMAGLDAPGLRVRVVQADIPQADKWTAQAFQDIFYRHMRLTAAPAGSGGTPDVVVWPEAAIPTSAAELLAPGSWTRAGVLDALRPGQVLMFGAVRVVGPIDRPIYYNSLLALRRTPEGLAPLGVYDKHRLVPFGEYLPLERWLTPLGLKKLAAVGDGFTAGPPPRPLHLDGIGMVQPLICYESLFPGFSRPGGTRPGWIVNVSNDAWFGRTSGPWQHLNLASYRAIEMGAPLVRATPTGVSAVVDGYGRVRAELALGKAGVIDAVLPPLLPATPYARLGDLFFWLLVLAGLTPAFFATVKFRW